jgi:hypothetical protein
VLGGNNDIAVLRTFEERLDWISKNIPVLCTLAQSGFLGAAPIVFRGLET